MKKPLSFIFLLAFFPGLFSCDEKEIPKPENLIPRQTMIEMMVDMHLVKALQQNAQPLCDSLKLSTSDLYYSVLAKYKSADSTYVRSLIYYSSHPKEYEKMYNEVINILMEKEPKEPGEQKLNVGNE